MTGDLEPLSEDTRSAILDAVALVEAQGRGDRLGVAVILHATSDPAHLRRVLGILAYMVCRYEQLDDPATLAAIRRTFVRRETTP
jgi:hypothetical protein